MSNEIKIDVASVKVMRSHDYCHFEVALSSTEATTPEAVDELRKTAARLADKAVKQYRIAKENASRRDSEGYTRKMQEHQMELIRKMPEGERTVNQQAELKAFDDADWAARREYDYEDTWED